MSETNKVQSENLSMDLRNKMNKIPGVNGNQEVSPTSNVEFNSVKIGSATLKYNASSKCMELIIP